MSAPWRRGRRNTQPPPPPPEGLLFPPAYFAHGCYTVDPVKYDRWEPHTPDQTGRCTKCGWTGAHEHGD